jgi:UDP-N-acetylglucosamine 3-dehydrogenase
MLNVGVIGVGSMGQNHARVYSEIANLVGIADVDAKATNKLAERFNTRVFKNYKELLDCDIDAVSIATPTKTHFEMAMDAMHNGKHVLIEKPMCSTIEQAKKLIETAEEQDLILAVGYVERHNPVIEFVKKALEKGSYGETITIVSRRVSSLPERIRDVGVILDLGTHDIDVMRYLVESEIESVYTLGGMTNSKFEDHANILIDFKNGVTGFVEVNWLTPMKVRKLFLTCLSNFVELDYITQSLTISSSQIMEYDVADLYSVPFEFDIRKVALKKQEPLVNELKDFLDAVTYRRRPLVNGKDGLETLRIANAAIKSYQTKEKVEVKY